MEGEAANTVVGKVGNLLFGVAKREINYMWNYTENVDKLRKEVQKLKDMRGRVQQRIYIATEKGDDLLDGVQKWVDKANAQISVAEEFLNQEDSAKKMCFSLCFNLTLYVNLGTLYHYGKMATNQTLSLLQHQEDGKTFESSVSVPTLTPRFVEVYQKKNLDGIDTQKATLGMIIKAIKDESIQIIGIYGLGGVGKTTLAEEVAASVNNLFADVVFITVSQNVVVEKIQKKVEVAAKRILKGEKILIILDDVWEELKLHELGIPCGIDYMNCKILLTSRSQSVCEEMNAQSNIRVETLPEDEAWILFKRVVGEGVETDANLKQVATKVVEECGGLPLIIQAVGKALKNKSIGYWKAAIHQLENEDAMDLTSGINKAFTRLKLSYDLLPNEDVKWCLLLCSVFPEDTLIPLELLVQYGVGLGKFNSLEDAGYKVRTTVDTLKSSFLLLDGYNEFTTKMHDVVRDMALFILSKYKKEFLVMAGKGLTEWPPRNYALESYRGISLMQNNICKLPDHELHLTLLDILLLQQNGNLSMISDEFIGGIKNVSVIDMEYNDISSLPQSLKQLTKLRMLNLGGNRSLHEIFILGELKDLEILILKDTGIEEIPQKMGELAKLRRLDVKRCKKLSHIAPGVISNLYRLEELCIGYHSVQEGNYNSLVELSCLSVSTFLDLFVPDFHLIPEGVHFGTLNRFVIQIGGRENDSYFSWELPSKRHLILEDVHHKIPFLMQIRKLIEASSDIHVESIQNLNNMLPSLHDEGFDELESILLSDCGNVSCLVDTIDSDEMQTFHPSEDLDEGKIRQMFFRKTRHLELSRLTKLKDIWNCPDQYISFSNLMTLNIESCPMLVRIFSVSVAQGLLNLQKLSISSCECLEEVIWARDEETSRGEIEKVGHAAEVEFPKLVEILLSSLPKLKNFCSDNSTIKYPSLLKVNAFNCRSMHIWGYGVHDTPNLKLVNEVPLDGPCPINDAVAKCYQMPTHQLGHIIPLQPTHQLGHIIPLQVLGSVTDTYSARPPGLPRKNADKACIIL